mmetsp:Transcript_5765/g.14318  ORF Transcript_5765/g.14318 Transcript_5765/m.14318 type:complete len:111 (-) Transcript_5765:100-432(-)
MPTCAHVNSPSHLQFKTSQTSPSPSPPGSPGASLPDPAGDPGKDRMGGRGAAPGCEEAAEGGEEAGGDIRIPTLPPPSGTKVPGAAAAGPAPDALPAVRPLYTRPVLAGW